MNYLVNFLVLCTRYRILLVYKDEETIFFLILKACKIFVCPYIRIGVCIVHSIVLLCHVIMNTFHRAKNNGWSQQKHLPGEKFM